MMSRTYQRGEIYYANLSPGLGSEQGGSRPVMILQNDTANQRAPTVIIAPITSKVGKKWKAAASHVVLEGLLRVPSLVLLEQTRTIDKCRLMEYLGRADTKTMKKVDAGLLVSLGIGAGRKGGGSHVAVSGVRDPHQP